MWNALQEIIENLVLFRDKQAGVCSAIRSILGGIYTTVQPIENLSREGSRSVRIPIKGSFSLAQAIVYGESVLENSAIITAMCLCV